MADEKTISLFNGAHMQSRVEFKKTDNLKTGSVTKRRVAMGIGVTCTERATRDRCGDENKRQYLSTHHHWCDETPGVGADEETGSSLTVVDVDTGLVGEEGLSGSQADAGSATLTGNNFNPSEQAARSRDDGTCLNLGQWRSSSFRGATTEAISKCSLSDDLCYLGQSFC